MNVIFAWWPVFILLPLPWLVKRYLREGRSPLAAPIRNHSLPYQESQGESQQRSRPSVWMWLIWAALVVALARPQWLDNATVPITEQGRNLLLAVDLSGSMQIQDMQWHGKPASRLATIRRLLGQFVQHRRGDRIGLVLFADHAYLESPLTFDTATIHHYVEGLQQGLVGNKTAIGEAIGMGVKELMKLPAKQRVMILLTDGQNTAGVIDPMVAARIAAQNHVVIYTIGLGAREMETPTIFGMQQVNPSQDLDESFLRHIAKMTGGEYFRAADSKQLQHIYQRLNQLVPIKGPKHYFRPHHELYQWPLALALLLLLIQPFMSLFAQQWRTLWQSH